MPKLIDIAPLRSTCFCEEDALIAAGVAVRRGLLLEIFDLEAANRIGRQHHDEQHPHGPPYQVRG